jgi:hypothetical protein
VACICSEDGVPAFQVADLYLESFKICGRQLLDGVKNNL